MISFDSDYQGETEKYEKANLESEAIFTTEDEIVFDKVLNKLMISKKIA